MLRTALMLALATMVAMGPVACDTLTGRNNDDPLSPGFVRTTYRFIEVTFMLSASSNQIDVFQRTNHLISCDNGSLAKPTPRGRKRLTGPTMTYCIGSDHPQKPDGLSDLQHLQSVAENLELSNPHLVHEARAAEIQVVEVVE